MAKVYVDEENNFFHPACVDTDREDISASEADGVICTGCGDVIEGADEDPTFLDAEDQDKEDKD